MLTPAKTYDDVYNTFQWQIPEFYNIGVDICDKWAHQRYRLALIYENEKGQVEKYTFWDLKSLSNQLANGLKPSGSASVIESGFFCRNALKPPSVISPFIRSGRLPFRCLPFSEPMPWRIDCRTVTPEAIVTDAANLPKILEIWQNLPHLKTDCGDRRRNAG